MSAVNEVVAIDAQASHLDGPVVGNRLRTGEKLRGVAGTRLDLDIAGHGTRRTARKR